MTRAVDSPLFRRDVVHRLALEALNAPHFPKRQLEQVLSLDRDRHAPIPSLSEQERRAVEEASRTLSMYSATQPLHLHDQDKLTALRLQYTEAGCALLCCDLGTAQRILESVARELRPRAQSTLSTSTDGMQLNATTLGTLQWLSDAQGHVLLAERYARWRADVQKKLTT